MQIMYDPGNALCHYGVLGMKWGRRRASRKAKKSVKNWEKSQKYSWKSLESRSPERAQGWANDSKKKYFKSKRQADKAMKIMNKIKKSEKALSKVSSEEKSTILKGVDEIHKYLDSNTPWVDIKKNKKRGAISTFANTR